MKEKINPIKSTIMRFLFLFFSILIFSSANVAADLTESLIGFRWELKPQFTSFIINGEPQSRNINYFMKWENNEAQLAKVRIRNTTPLPSGITIVETLSNKYFSINWTPPRNKKTEHFEVGLEATVTAANGQIFKYQNVLNISSRPDLDHPALHQWSTYVECQETLRLWGEENIPEEISSLSNSDEQAIPQNYTPSEEQYYDSVFTMYALRSDFQNDPLRHFYASRFLLFYSRYISGPLGRPINADLIRFLMGSAFFFDDKYLENFKATYLETESNPSANPDAKYSLFAGNPIAEAILQAHHFQKAGFNSNSPIFRNLKDKLLGLKTNKGIDLPTLYLVYLLSNNEFQALDILKLAYKNTPPEHVPNISQLESEIISLAKGLMTQKTSPSLVCNNLAANIEKQRIPFDKLGMDGYEPPINPLYWNPTTRFIAPWLTDKIVQNVGRSMYDNPEVWELSKALPLFGTTLAILDGSLTLYTGEDLQANKVDRRLALLSTALDVVPASIGAFSKFRQVPELISLANEVKQLKATGRLDNMIIAAEKSIDAMKKYLKYDDLPIGAVPCGLNAAGKLSDKLSDLASSTKTSIYGAKPSELGAKLCVVNKFGYFKKNQDRLSHAKRAFLDTNAIKHIGQWQNLLKRKNNNALEAFRALREETEELKFHLVITARAAEEAGVKHGLRNGYATNATYNELAHGRDGLLSKDELEAVHNKTDLVFSSSSVLVHPPLPDNLRQAHRTSFYEKLHETLKTYGFGDEIKKDGSIHPGETMRNGGRAGDLNIFLEFMITYRMDHLPNQPIPTLFISDRKFGIDVYNMMKGDNLLSKYDSIEEAYRAILKNTAGKLILAKLTKQSMFDAITKAGKNIDINEIPDLSNLPFRVTYLPLNCGHFRDAGFGIVRNNFPDTNRLIDELLTPR